MARGMIVKALIDLNFGFIRPNGHGADVWFQRGALQGGLEWDEQLIYRAVEYETTKGRDGRTRAENVRPAW